MSDFMGYIQALCCLTMTLFLIWPATLLPIKSYKNIKPTHWTLIPLNIIAKVHVRIIRPRHFAKFCCCRQRHCLVYTFYHVEKLFISVRGGGAFMKRVEGKTWHSGDHSQDYLDFVLWDLQVKVRVTSRPSHSHSYSTCSPLGWCLDMFRVSAPVWNMYCCNAAVQSHFSTSGSVAHENGRGCEWCSCRNRTGSKLQNKVTWCSFNFD